MQSNLVDPASLAELVGDKILSIRREVYIANGHEVAQNAGDLELTMEGSGPWLLSSAGDQLAVLRKRWVNPYEGGLDYDNVKFITDAGCPAIRSYEHEDELSGLTIAAVTLLFDEEPLADRVIGVTLATPIGTITAVNHSDEIEVHVTLTRP